MSFHLKSKIPHSCPQFVQLLPNVEVLSRLQVISKYPIWIALYLKDSVRRFRSVSGWHPLSHALLCKALKRKIDWCTMHTNFLYSLFVYLTVCWPVNFPSASVSNLKTKIPGRFVSSSPIKSVCNIAPIPYWLWR